VLLTLLVVSKLDTRGQWPDDPEHTRQRPQSALTCR